MKTLFWKTIAALLIFGAMQLLFAPILTWAGVEFYDTLGLTTILSGVITCIVIHFGLGMIQWHECFRAEHIGWHDSIHCTIGVCAAIFCMNALTEKLELPDLMSDYYDGMFHNAYCIIAVAIVGPICEELVFREGIQGLLQRNGVGTWTAILCSAACFGLIHGNPSQIPFAFILGIIFSLIYYKTKSILIPCILHVFNNSLIMFLYMIMGKDVDLEQVVGGSLMLWILIVACALLSVITMWHFLPSKVEEQSGESCLQDRTTLSGFK